MLNFFTIAIALPSLDHVVVLKVKFVFLSIKHKHVINDWVNVVVNLQSVIIKKG